MKTITQKTKAFFNGIYEFKSSFTTYYEDLALLEIYNMGRELAHVLTFHHYEQF
jgi:hypothetical protein